MSSALYICVCLYVGATGPYRSRDVRRKKTVSFYVPLKYVTWKRTSSIPECVKKKKTVKLKLWARECSFDPFDGAMDLSRNRVPVTC